VSRKKILVIEDDPVARAAVHAQLTAQGYAVALAADAASAMTAANRHRPDLVLLDLGLPGGDGFLVMERLAANVQLAATPVVVITGRDDPASRARARALGAREFLPKPVDHPALLAALRAVLGE
jgi:DNA-binding response OmpR family regulator